MLSLKQQTTGLAVNRDVTKCNGHRRRSRRHAGPSGRAIIAVSDSKHSGTNINAAEHSPIKLRISADDKDCVELE